MKDSLFTASRAITGEAVEASITSFPSFGTLLFGTDLRDNISSIEARKIHGRSEGGGIMHGVERFS